MTNQNYSATVLDRWGNDPFYTRALVLAVDIGTKYIGLHLRLGRDVLAGETVLFEPRASLSARRQQRHLRRNRRGRKQRLFQLRRWCQRFGLPWAARADWQREMEQAFALRLRGETQPGSLTPAQLVVCLRHLLLRRGYDWHRFSEQDGHYPWGDASPLSKGGKLSSACENWLAGHHLTPAIIDRIKESLPTEGEDEALDRNREFFLSQLQAALDRSNRQSLLVHLRDHVATPVFHRARNKNYPREVLVEHAQNLLRNHASILPTSQVEAATIAYLDILNYHRKDKAAQQEHWESKTADCPFYPGVKRAPASDLDVLRFRLLEFLATRRFAVALGRGRQHRGLELRHAPAAVVAWVLEHPQGQAEPLPLRGAFRAEFDRRVCAEGESLAADARSLNGDFFAQLRDLRYPRPASAAQRAALSARAAREWFDHATCHRTDLTPANVRERLAKQPGPQGMFFYERRREAALAEWFHPHTEFLLGPRAFLLREKDRHGRERQAPAGQIHGWLNRLLAREKIADRLQAIGHSGKPDYVMIEVAGDIARTADGRRKIEAEQKKRRDARGDFMEHYGLTRGDDSALLRAELWEQQGGTHEPGAIALCPLTGAELRGGPLNPDFEIAHIYPDSWGGPYQRDNLFLTTSTVNAEMGNQPPAACTGYQSGGAARAKLMKWSQRKKDLFTTPWTRGQMPGWGFDTRVAQLARQLRDAMKSWLGITDENEFARRVGTLSGYFTAQCRKAWLVGYRKDRADLRNHLYDAMVLAHIPPGPGLNHAACGGIFCTTATRQTDGSLRFIYQPPRELGPDWQAFDRAHEHDCLVKVPRSASTKRSRFDQSIYGIEPALRDGEDRLRLRIREQIIAPNIKIADLEKWFAAESARSPAFAKLFPEKMWQGWINENVRRKANGEPALPLELPGFAPVRAISVDASKPSFFDPRSLASHDSGRGAKSPVERNFALDLFEVPPPKDGGKTEIVSRPILHPRFARMQARWRELDVEVEAPAPLPANAKRVARVTKSTRLCLPLKRDGAIAASWDDAYRRVWAGVTALNTSGQIEMKPVEFQPAEFDLDNAGAISRPDSRLFGLKLKSVYKLQNESLLALIRLNAQLSPL